MPKRCPCCDGGGYGLHFATVYARVKFSLAMTPILHTPFALSASHNFAAASSAVFPPHATAPLAYAEAHQSHCAVWRLVKPLKGSPHASTSSEREGAAVEPNISPCAYPLRVFLMRSS